MSWAPALNALIGIEFEYVCKGPQLMEISNIKLAKILRNVAAAYVIKNIGNIFQIKAYCTLV